MGTSCLTALVEKPANGTCSIEGDQLVYMPNPGFTGMENLNIEVSDGTLSETATLELPIREHPDPSDFFFRSMKKPKAPT